MSSHTDAPVIFHEFLSAALVGALLAREPYKCRVSEGVGGTWTNLWVLIVGDSGRDHKSTAIRMVEKILMMIDPSIRGPDDMTPEGLLQVFKEFETTWNTQQTGPGPNLFMIYSEFVHLLFHFKRQYSSGLRPLLIKLYDVDPLYRRQLKKSFLEIQEPRCSLMGGIPSELLAQHSSPEDWDGGFLNRFLLVAGAKTRDQEGRPSIPEKVFTALAGKLAEALEAFRQAQLKRDFAPIVMGAEAKKIGNELQRAMMHETDIVLARAQDHFTKLAAINQIDIDPQASEISKDAALRSLEMVEEWKVCAAELSRLCKTVGRENFEGDRLAKTILRHLDRRGGFSVRSEIYIACGLNSKACDEGLVSLAEAGLVTFSQPSWAPTYVAPETGSLPVWLTTAGKGASRTWSAPDVPKIKGKKQAK